MPIFDLNTADEALIQQAAQLLVEAFREHWPDAWPEIESALESTHEMLGAAKICLGMVEGDQLLGWIGGQPEYDGNVWELHPMVVRPALQKHGIGRALIAALEAEVERRGGLTIMLGTDDEDDMTSLAKADLYTDLPAKIANIRNLRGHPYEFYQKCGYSIIGVMPDANGRGKPDIYMAKRIGI